MQLKQIAVFRSPFGSKFGVPRQSGLVPDIPGEIHFLPEYQRKEALRGLSGFDYIWIIWEFSANAAKNGWDATVRPPRLGGNVSMGVFATRSPYRPNPLGLSSVRLLEVDEENLILKVSGADLVDGTPIFDIKPYIPYTDSHPDASAGFVDAVAWKNRLDIIFPEDLKSLFRSPDTLESVLAQDPRPGYHDDPERIYGLLYEGRDVHFRVEGKVLTVLSVD